MAFRETCKTGMIPPCGTPLRTRKAEGACAVVTEYGGMCAARHRPLAWLLPSLILLCVNPALSADPADAALDLAQRTLAYVERTEKRPEYAAQLARYALALSRAKDPMLRKALERDIRTLRRKIILSHPDLAFDKILAVQRGIPYAWDAHMVDQYLGRWSRPGPGLVIIEDWKTAPRKREPLKGKLPRGTVLNPDLHWDADRVVFAFCNHEIPQPDILKKMTVPIVADHSNPRRAETIRALDPENPIFTLPDGTPNDWERETIHLRYFLYEAATDGSWVRQLTGCPGDPMTTAGGRQTVVIEDIDPCYLPDGGIVFSSTRCQSLGRCHWGRYTPAFLLYRMDGDGKNIRQLSFGEANEWEPTVLNDGRIAYTRWDYINRNAVWYQSLWTIRPDGTGTAHFYGNYTRNPCIQTEVKAIPGSHVVVATAAAHHYVTAGSIFTIDPRKGEDGPDPITRVTAEIPFPESEGWDLPGTYAGPMPINDTLFLVSHSEEPMRFPTATIRNNGTGNNAWPSRAAYGIWLVDTLGGRELIFKDDAVSTFNPIPLIRRVKPPVLPSVLPPPEEAPDTGICYVKDVYNSRVAIPKGTVKALRLNRLINQPAVRRDTPNQPLDLELYKETLGVVPVSESGSALFRMPAGMPIQLQAIDAEGKAVMTMRSFIYVQKGETLGCVGCHESKRNAPTDFARDLTIANPKREIDLGYTGNLNYNRSIQPIFDRHCIRCHGLGEAKMSLIGANAHRELINRKQISIIKAYEESGESKPYDYFAAASPLVKRLKSGHGKVTLSDLELRTIYLWLDMNPARWGKNCYSHNVPENRSVNAAGEKAFREAVAARWGEAIAAQPLDALLNRVETAKSRVLLAALPAAAGGWGLFEKPFTGTDDPDYIRLADLAEKVFDPLPAHDVQGTCDRTPCLCNSCWVRLSGLNNPK